MAGYYWAFSLAPVSSYVLSCSTGADKVCRYLEQAVSTNIHPTLCFQVDFGTGDPGRQFFDVNLS